METAAPRGTKDMLPAEAGEWIFLENLFRDIASRYGAGELRTPTFEYTHLFERGAGESSDMVTKEMYTFLDKGKRSITLKAEGTAPAVRAFVEHRLGSGTLPVKLFYTTPVFRYEKPQAGRLREHHQFGIEIFGSPIAAADAEVISIARDIIEGAGISGAVLKINSVGCSDCRPDYNTSISSFLGNQSDSLCGDCRIRREKNPLRVLDCKNEACRTVVEQAPSILDALCAGCGNHMEELMGILNSCGIGFTVDCRMVRGLDYYSRTAFEFVSSDLGAVATVCGGGRYDRLVEELGGPPMPAVGFGMGVERLIILRRAAGVTEVKPPAVDLWLVTAPGTGLGFVLSLADSLRRAGSRVESDLMGRSFKSQMKNAGKSDALALAVVGEAELASSVLKVKELLTGTEVEVSVAELPGYLMEIRNRRTRRPDSGRKRND